MAWTMEPLLNHTGGGAATPTTTKHSLTLIQKITLHKFTATDLIF